jgi:hypothetical protein
MLSRRFLVCAPVIGLVALSALSPVRGRAQEPPETPAASDARPTADPRLKQASDALRSGRHTEAAHLLKSMDLHTLDPKDARRWRSLASQAAVRTGDKAWLDEIARDPERFSNLLNLLTVTVVQLLWDGELDEARALLGRIKDPENLDEIPRRRYLQLYARLEQLSGNKAAERIYVAKLVDFAGLWASDTCQGCHANLNKYGEQVTTLDVSNWWVGERFTALLQESGDAAKVRAAAEKRLAANPKDDAARLRIAYALRAEGGTVNRTKAETQLRALPWAEFPDREKRPPLRLATFP